MRHGTHLCLMRVALLAVAMLAGAYELTVRSIVMAHGAGATSDGLVAAVSDPVNTMHLTAGDIVAPRGAGGPDRVVGAIEARAGDP